MPPPEHSCAESRPGGVTIHLNGLENWPALADARSAVVAAARTAIGADPGLTDGELSITLVDDDEMARLNVEWLDRTGSTDVIAFSLGSAESVLGDVYIAPDTAGKNAAGLGVDLLEEILRLVIHGTLHVVGYDHPEGPDRSASEMYRLQEELLRGLEVR
jgi:probable rRNA maturation factor